MKILKNTKTVCECVYWYLCTLDGQWNKVSQLCISCSLDEHPHIQLSNMNFMARLCDLYDLVNLLSFISLLGLMSLNPIVWCYVWHYVVINKIVLLLSKMMVTYIFGHYQIAYEMHCMWFM